jgi:prepilin-type N-terminal cleavage/methylation domain-containing protein
MKKRKKGFTLIESVMAIVLIGIISLVFSAYINESFRAWVFMGQEKQATFQSEAAVTRIIKEIKRIQHNTAITTWTSTTLTFTNLDAITITFTQTGTNLMMNSDVLMQNLANPGGLAFTYLKADGATAAAVNEVSLIKVRLKALINGRTYVNESAAYFRPQTL